MINILAHIFLCYYKMFVIGIATKAGVTWFSSRLPSKLGLHAVAHGRTCLPVMMLCHRQTVAAIDGCIQVCFHPHVVAGLSDPSLKVVVKGVLFRLAVEG